MGVREIIFRAKDLNGNWAFGFYSPRIWFPSFEQTPNIKTFKGSDVEININTLGQYTGLKDKNGKEIYEGDIVKGCSKSYKKNYLCEVYFNENMCHYGLTINRGSYTKHQTHDWLELTKTKASKLEVIGNIFDNGELLNED